MNTEDPRGRFEDSVMTLVRANWPDAAWHEDETGVRAIQIGELTIGLDNLYRYVQSENLSTEELEQAILLHFDKALAPVDEGHSWDEAREIVFPQLISEEFIRQSPAVVAEKILPGVFLAFALDERDRYVYIIGDDLARWGVDQVHLKEIALQNLESITEEAQFEWRESESGNREDTWGCINIADGYAAVRIALANVRATIATTLGDEFFFAIPNRDFLIFWAKQSPFSEGFIENVAQDYEEHTYPLSPQIFIGNAAGVNCLVE